MKQLDMMGQSCPIPVVNARRALAENDGVVVLVDNAIAVQNLEKMARGEGHSLTSQMLAPGQFEVTILRTGAVVEPVQARSESAHTSDLTMLIGRKVMGAGADELGAMLMKGFIFSLTELPEPPERLIFLNGGAWLTTQGANTVADLQVLQGKGTRIYTCGTCANFFGLAEQLAVGEITDMMNIVRMLDGAGRLVML